MVLDLAQHGSNVLNVLKTFDGTVGQEVDLFHHQIFDFPCHDRIGLFDNLLCLFRFVFQRGLILLLERPDELLQFSFFLVVVLDIAKCSLDGALE